jgi:putative transcriptional regulator
MDHPTQDMQSFRGKILLATPAMDDPRFAFSVIYMIGHDASGAMGFIINKAKSGLNISDLLDQIGIEGDVNVADTPVLDGGPVDLDRGFVIHSLDYFKSETSLKVSESLGMTPTKDAMESLVSDTPPKQAIMAIGYAGWSAGQLEAEIADNAWLVSDGDDALIFSDDFAGKWATALSAIGIDPSSLSQSGGRA